MMLIILLWILLISLFTIFGAYYARKFNRPDALIGLYVSFVLISNILAVKIALFDFGIISFTATAATLIFSVTFLITDIVNEKFGRKETQKMILIAFISQIAATFFIWMAISLPSASFWSGQEVFTQMFGLVPRIIFASWIAFLISENADAYIFSWFKRKTNGRHLWMRNAFSSIPSMALDTGIFVAIAFYGAQPLLPLILGIIAIKWLVAIVDIPFMYLSREIMNR